MSALQKYDDKPFIVCVCAIGKNHLLLANTTFLSKISHRTKIMVLASAPKGYNLDKMLEFLSDDKSVFMIFFVGINYARKSIKTKLVSMFQSKLIDNTVVQSHWAGRHSRGVSQFNGEAVKRIILNEENTIDILKAKAFLERITAI
ncbi:MAG: hypothetical protein LBO82_01865 [Synergistaceae bacterium]|nr:hypothetical protein [Synergistaceae bacterium]